MVHLLNHNGADAGIAGGSGNAATAMLSLPEQGIPRSPHAEAVRGRYHAWDRSMMLMYEQDFDKVSYVPNTF